MREIRTEDSSRIVPEHAPILAYIRSAFILHTMDAIDRTYDSELRSILSKRHSKYPNYRKLDPKGKMEVFRQLATSQPESSVRLWFAASEQDGFWCYNPKTKDDDKWGDPVLVEPDDLSFGEHNVPDPSNALSFNPYAPANRLLYGIDPIYATVLIANELQKLIPSMMPFEACEFAVTGIYPETRHALVLPHKCSTTLLGYTVRIATTEPTAALLKEISESLKQERREEWSEKGWWGSSMLGERASVQSALNEMGPKLKGGKEATHVMVETVRSELEQISAFESDGQFWQIETAEDGPERKEVDWDFILNIVNDTLKERLGGDDHRYPTAAELRKSYKKAMKLRGARYSDPFYEEVTANEAKNEPFTLTRLGKDYGGKLYRFKRGS